MSYRFKKSTLEWIHSHTLTYTKLYYVSKTIKDIGKTKPGQEKWTLRLICKHSLKTAKLNAHTNWTC